MIARRRFLAGAGGLLVALPFLEGLAPRRARADGPDQRFFLSFRQWFGVQQRPRFGGSLAGESEGFWPDADVQPGQAVALTKELLQKSQNGDIRATGELADFAPSLLMLRGVRVSTFYRDHAALHRRNLVQGMTGSYSQPTRPGHTASEDDDDNNAWPMHETLDTFISRQLGVPVPTVFEAVINDAQTSYRNDPDGGIPLPNPTFQQPSAAFQQMFTQAQLDAKAQLLRTSVTDAVLSEIKSLRADPRLSQADRQRLDQHFDAMNQLETKLKCAPPGLDSPLMASALLADGKKPGDDSMQLWQAKGDFNQYVEYAASAFIEIAALGASCGAFRAGTIVMPAPTSFDHSDIFSAGSGEYSQGFPGHYHSISHRSFNDTSDNTGGQAATDAHHRIDRWHGRMFARLLGRLRDYGILDQGITLWSNEIGHGDHWCYDMPHVIAGSGGGRLRTGQYVDLQTSAATDQDTSGDIGTLLDAIRSKQTPNARVLNTLGAALGLTSGNGKPLEDFGGFERDPLRNELPRITGNLASLLKTA